MRFILTLLFLACAPAYAQQSIIRPDVIETISGSKNYIKNPSAAKNTLSTVTSSATLTRVTTSGNKLDGIASFQCDSSAQNGFCEWLTNTITDGDDVGNCEASFLYKGDASLYVLQVTDGTNALINSSQLTNESSWRSAIVNYPCGATRRVRLFQNGAGNGAAVNLGKIYYGKATNVGMVDPVGDWTAFTPTGSFVANTTYTGFWRRVGGDAEIIYKLAFAGVPTTASLTLNLPSGMTIDTGKLIDTSISYGQIPTEVATLWDVSATSNFALSVFYNNTTSIALYQQRTFSGTNPVNVALGQAVTQASPTAIASGDAILVKVRVPIVGWGTQSAVRADQTNYDWTSYTPTFTGFGTVTSPECFHKRDGSDLLIRCKGTSGTPTATEARISLPGSLVSAGTALIPSIQKAGDFARGVSAGSSFSFNVLIEPSVSYVTVGVQGSAAAGMTKANGSTLVGSAEVFSFVARIPIAGWSETLSAPVLIGSVTSGAAGAERTERATLTCSGSSTVNTQSGSWISSVGNISSGACVVTIGSGFFSSAPTCYASFLGGIAGTNSRTISPVLSSATSITLDCSTGAADCTSFDASLICVGPR